MCEPCKHDCMAKDLDALTSKLDSMEQEIVDQAMRIRALQGVYEDLMKTSLDIEKQRDDAQAEIERLKAENEKLHQESEEDFKNTERQLESLNLQLREIRGRLAQAVSGNCTCGGEGPKDGCDWCKAYHYVFETEKSETRVCRCAEVKLHNGELAKCDFCTATEKAHRDFGPAFEILAGGEASANRGEVEKRGEDSPAPENAYHDAKDCSEFKYYDGDWRCVVCRRKQRYVSR